MGLSCRAYAVPTTVAVLFLAGSPSAIGQTTYNAAAGFTFTSPQTAGSLWTYGSKATGSFDSDTLTLYNTQGDFSTGGALSVWLPPAEDMFVGKNVTGSNVGVSNTTFKPGQLVSHAGPSKGSVIRFTAPTADTYTLSLAFSNATTSAGTNVYVYQQTVGQLYTGQTLNSSDTPVVYSGPSLLTLAAGSWVDIIVGPRTDLSSNSTSTTIDATFTPVPEPGSVLGVASAGLLGIGWLRRRRFGRAGVPAPSPDGPSVGGSQVAS